MIASLAFRNIAYRPWRSVLLFFGFGVGVAVMLVLLSIGEAMLSQARNEKLVGGGTVTVLPEGLDVEVMKTGGIGGLFFSIDHAAFLYRQLFASPRFSRDIAAVAPQIERRLLYVRTNDGREFPVQAAGEIPSLTRAVGAAAEVVGGRWEDDRGDQRWAHPTLVDLRNEIDHFHLPSDSVKNRDTWAEWHYFNVMLPGGRKWAFISFIVGGDVTSDKWGGQIGITLREQGGRTRRFALGVNRTDIRFATTDANLLFGDSHVMVLPNGDYDVKATALEGDASRRGGRIDIRLQVHPEPYAYFQGVAMGAGEFVSGYTVPGLRASASGKLCVDGVCENLQDAQSYHDHNWGVWRGVTWDWGATRAGEYTLLYGRVYPPDTSSVATPVLVYLIDSLGFRAVFRPKNISYTDGRTVTTSRGALHVPSSASFAEVRGDDTVRVDVQIEDAIATDTRPRAINGDVERGDPLRTDKLHPFFIQMKGTATISGRLEGKSLTGSGTGFFETYR
jgi:hypothetical protein